MSSRSMNMTRVLVAIFVAIIAAGSFGADTKEIEAKKKQMDLLQHRIADLRGQLEELESKRDEMSTDPIFNPPNTTKPTATETVYRPTEVGRLRKQVVEMQKGKIDEKQDVPVKVTREGSEDVMRLKAGFAGDLERNTIRGDAHNLYTFKSQKIKRRSIRDVRDQIEDLLETDALKPAK